MPLRAETRDAPSDEQFMLSIYEQFFPIMYKTAIDTLADKQAVSDLLQDCMVKLIGHVDTLRLLHPRALIAYLVTTVRNAACSYNRGILQRDKYIQFADVPDAELTDAAPSPEDTVIYLEQMELYNRSLNSLSESDRELLRGRYELGLDDKALAEIVGCKPDSVRMKLTRARRRIVKLMKEGGAEDYVETK